jgi:hypothetical protein
VDRFRQTWPDPPHEGRPSTPGESDLPLPGDPDATSQWAAGWVRRQVEPFGPCGLGWLLTLSLFFGAVAFWRLIYPFDWIDEPAHAWLQSPRVGKLNTFSNLVIFVPFAFTAAWWARSRGWGAIAAVTTVTAMVAVLALIGETVQLWQAERGSSLFDLITNTLGALAGAAVGFGWAGWLQRGWDRAAALLQVRPMGRRALMLIVLVLLVRTAPFDFTLETQRLRLGAQATLRAGQPFAKTQALRQAHNPSPQVIAAARREQWRAAAAALLFGITAFGLSRAMREHFALAGDFRSPALSVLVSVSLLIVLTEGAQGFIESRVMDTTEPVAAAGGMLVGQLLDAFRGRRSPRHRVPVPRWTDAGEPPS